jgi:hypothetical protein
MHLVGWTMVVGAFAVASPTSGYVSLCGEQGHYGQNIGWLNFHVHVHVHLIIIYCVAFEPMTALKKCLRVNALCAIYMICVIIITYKQNY